MKNIWPNTLYSLKDAVNCGIIILSIWGELPINWCKQLCSNRMVSMSLKHCESTRPHDTTPKFRKRAVQFSIYRPKVKRQKTMKPAAKVKAAMARPDANLKDGDFQVFREVQMEKEEDRTKHRKMRLFWKKQRSGINHRFNTWTVVYKQKRQFSIILHASHWCYVLFRLHQCTQKICNEVIGKWMQSPCHNVTKADGMPQNASLQHLNRIRIR